MTDAGFPRIAVCGAEHAALALSLARAGCCVVLFEPDPHDRTRLSDMLGRGGTSRPEGLRLTGAAAAISGSDIVLASPLPPGVEAGEVPVLSLDWAGDAGTALQLSQVPGRRPLLECLGPDTGGHVAAIADALDARLAELPGGHVPPSQRLLAVLSAEVEALALQGATPTEIDDALAGAGFALGPFEAQDLAGIDSCLSSRRAVFARHGGPPELPLMVRAVAEGRLGRKVGVGWYRYPGGGGKVEDPLVEDMAMEEARFAGMARAEPSAETIRARVTGVLRAEAARIVAEGVATVTGVDEIAQLAVGSPPGMLL